MITRLTVQNFQNHGLSILDLSPGVNVISGPSDNGKSAIVRALRWAIENKPLGDSFCKTGTKDTSVTIDMGDVRVERFRNGRNNGYRMGEEIFLATKGTVPKEIADALDIAPPCLQNQTDPYYLLSLSPGEVARHLSQLADLSEIDTAIRKSNSLIGKTQVEAKFAETEIANLESKLADTEHLSAVEGLLRRVETAITRSEAKVQRWGILDEITDGIYWAETDLGNLQPILAAGPMIAELQQALTKHAAKQGRHTGIAKLLGAIDSQQKDLVEAEALGDSLSGMYELSQALAVHESKIWNHQSIAQHCTNIDIAARQVKAADDEITLAEKELVTLRGTLGTCPTCGATMVQDVPTPAPRRRP